MIAACEHAGIALRVIFQMRFDPLSRQLKSMIASGKLGRLLWNSASTIWYRTDEYYRSSPWRGTIANSGGGVLINQAIHLIDFMLWLADMPTSVTVRTKTLNHRIAVEDGAVAILEYADNRLGLIQATTVAYPGYTEQLEFHGTRGSAVCHKGQGKLECHIAGPREDGMEQMPVDSGVTKTSTDAEGRIMQYQDFVAANRGRRPALIDGREGRKSVQLVEAIYRSAKTNTTIEIKG